MPIKINNCTISDISSIRAILIETWRDSYTEFVPEDDLNLYLEEYYNKENLTKIINSKNNQTFIALIEDIPVGWMRLKVWKEMNQIFLSSLYVIPKYQNFGIGRKFLKLAFKEAKKKNFDRIQIGVMDKNKRAIEIYEKIGFVFNDSESFKMGKTEVMYKIGAKVL